MKIIFKKLSLLLCVILCFGLITGITVFGDSGKKVDIVFTSDIHSHLDSFTSKVDGNDKNVGGIARIKTIIEDIRSKNSTTITVDAGDFSMGTLYQTAFENSAIELSMLTKLRYDAFTLGNHEFDYGATGLYCMLETAYDNENRPSLVLCNADLYTGKSYTQAIAPGLHDYGLKDYTIIERDGVRIAVIGVFGKDALECAPTCKLNFKDPVESVKNAVKEIKSKENADMIVCLSHSGIAKLNSDISEDEKLAREVPELDVIVSGHSHLLLEKPIVSGDTYIVACGYYGINVGNITLTQKDDGRWENSKYELIPVNQDVKEDSEIASDLNEYNKQINSDYLNQYGYNSADVLASCNVDFEDSYLLEKGDHKEYRLGNFMADAMRIKTGADIAVVPAGLIRDSFYNGDIDVSQVFNSFSLGMGADETYGYPLTVVYLTGSELKTIAEVDSSISDKMNTARLYTSGFGFTFNPNRMFLNRMTETFLIDDEGNRLAIDNKKLYSVVTDLYSCQMLSSVTKKSYGLLKLIPKDKNGKVIKDFNKSIIKEDGKELKGWKAIADYMVSFDKGENGKPSVPIEYAKTMGRKNIDNDKSIGAILSHPNKIAIMLYSAVIFIIVVIVLLIVIIAKSLNKKKRSLDKK